MSHTAVILICMFFTGAATGLVFFSGLWLTLKLVIARRGRYLWLLVSFMLRTGLVCSVFYFLMQGDWQRLVALAAGFLLARILFVRAAKLNLNNYSEAGNG